MSNNLTMGLLLAAFVVVAIFARDSVAGIFIALAIAAIAIGPLRKSKT